MSRDPIIQALAVLATRVHIFIILSITGWLLLWLLVLIHGYQVQEWALLWHITREVWPPAHDPTLTLLCAGCGLISVLITLVTFLAIALWWHKRGDVRRRSSRFIDRRES